MQNMRPTEAKTLLAQRFTVSSEWRQGLAADFVDRAPVSIYGS